jgi:hypothetical protein
MCRDHQTPRTETTSTVQDIDDVVDNSHEPWFRDTWVSKRKKNMVSKTN